MRLDKSIPVPLYYQLAELIKERVDAGELKPGAQVPSERQLAEEVGISRITARQAVAYLIHQGILEARPGVGTYVVDPKLSHDPLHLLGFTEEMARQGRPVTSQVLEQVVVVPPARIATGLNLQPSDTTIKIVRLRLSQDAPLFLETSFVPTTVCPGLEGRPLVKESLYALLEQACGLAIVRSRQTLESVTANAAEAALFRITAGAPMILLEGVAYLEDDRPLEYFKAVYRGDRFKFELESHRDSSLALAEPQRMRMAWAFR